MNIKEHIENSWEKCCHCEQQDEGTLIGLPYPYIVPTVGPMFREMYYWDTYFTNLGLIVSGRAISAKQNVDNMLYLVERFGFMPNGNRTYYQYQSQAPFLSMMVSDIYDVFRDKVWLRGAYFILEKEYEYWMTKRITPIGLNQYACGWPEWDYEQKASDYFNRTGLSNTLADAETAARSYGADCESGWDCNPRCVLEQIKSVYVDLNSNLYRYEKNFAHFSRILGLGCEEEWEKKAEARHALMRKYMWDGSAFVDYNFVDDKFSPVFSVASFYPLFAGLATKEEAESTVKRLSELELDFGISVCAKHNVEGVFQWDYPNGWAPLQWVTIRGLSNYGYDEDAKRVAQKYVDVTENNFEKTGNLWEKYNAFDGSLTVNNEYEMPAMIGWSAGVYLKALKFLEK